MHHTHSIAAFVALACGTSVLVDLLAIGTVHHADWNLTFRVLVACAGITTLLILDKTVFTMHHAHNFGTYWFTFAYVAAILVFLEAAFAVH